MPNKALQLCAHPGCPEVVKGGLCTNHARERNTINHNPAWMKFYNTLAWKRRRAEQLAREPWCSDCLESGVYTPATDADHKEPHRGDPVKFFKGELQSLCHSHHSAKTAVEVGFISPGGRGEQKSVGGGITARVAFENSVYGIDVKKVP